MLKKIMFFAALVCGLSFAGAAEQYGSIGNMAGSWKGYFGALKNYSNLAIPETLECKVLFISSVAQKNIHLSEKEYNTLLNFCRNGGILVIDSAANGRFLRQMSFPGGLPGSVRSLPVSADSSSIPIRGIWSSSATASRHFTEE